MNTKLSHRVSAWSTLPTAALHGKVIEMQNAGVDIIDLTIGISNRPIPKAGQEAAIEAITSNNVPYTAIGGTTELKKALQQKLLTENNISAELDNIIVSTGAKQAIFQALYVLTNPGDGIMLFQPCWPAYTQIATMLSLTPQFLNLDEIPSLLSKKISPNIKVLILNNPHNPTGKVFTKDELTAIAAFAKKNNIYILSDESYEKLVYEGEHVSMQPVDEGSNDKVITVFSVSQSFSMMGWRLGYTIANQEIIKAMESVQSSITAGTSAVTQTAVSHILNLKNEYISELTADFKKRRNIIFEKIQAIDWIQCQMPQSGPYFWCNIEKLTTDGHAFCKQFLEKEKVAVMPGDTFGIPGCWIRIAFNVEPTETLEIATERLTRFGQDYAK